VSPEAVVHGRSGSTPLIDPRLRDRRIEVARTEGRKRLRRVAGLVVVLLLVGGAIALTRSPLLDVDRIVVRGTDEVAAAEVREAAGIAIGEPLLDVDATAAARRIEALAWVERATVERSWPSELVVRIERRVPVAVVGPAGAPLLVDADGLVLGPADASTTGDDADALPEIDGRSAPVGSALSEGQREVAALVGALPDELREQVLLARSVRGGMELELADGLEVRWGDASQRSAKADALRVLLDQDDRSTFATIDVSVPGASTVTFRDVASG
jgi:cell division protein FtsQ